MLKETGGFGDSAIATLNTSAISAESLGIHGNYHAICYDENGDLKWEEQFPNLVNAVGKQLMLNTLLVTASGYTLQGPFLGLISGATTPSYAQGDTFASHTGWTEFTSYTVLVGATPTAQRGTAVFSSATNGGQASPSNVVTCAAAAITYTITGTGTVAGCFLLTGTGATAAFTNTSSGTLYSAGSFATSKSVTSGDTIAVTYSTTATS